MARGEPVNGQGADRTQSEKRKNTTGSEIVKEFNIFSCSGDGRKAKRSPPGGGLQCRYKKFNIIRLGVSPNLKPKAKRV